MKTPRSRVKGMLRQIFLRSKERNATLKRDNYTCVDCHRKQTMKKGQELKVQVHHINTVDKHWQEIIDLIFKYVLCDIDDLETVCKECHDKKE